MFLFVIWFDNLVLEPASRRLAWEAFGGTFDLAHNYTSTMFLLQQWQSWLPKSSGTPASSPWTAAGFLVIRASLSLSFPLPLSLSLVSVAPGERLILDIQRIAAFVSEI